MLDIGSTSAFPEGTLIFSPGGTGWPGDLKRLLPDPRTRVGLYHPHNPARLLPRTFEAHASCRVGTLIRLDVAGTRITVPSPPMGAQVSFGIAVVASTPDRFLLGNPTWWLEGGHLGTGVANPLAFRFRLGRSNGPAGLWILVVERHLSLPLAGRSSALIGQPDCTLERCLGAGSTARHVEKPVWRIVPPVETVAYSECLTQV